METLFCALITVSLVQTLFSFVWYFVCLVVLIEILFRKYHFFIFPRYGPTLGIVDFDAVKGKDFGMVQSEEWGLETSGFCWRITFYSCFVIFG